MTVVMALERDRFMVVTTLQNNVQEQLCIYSGSFSQSPVFAISSFNKK